MLSVDTDSFEHATVPTSTLRFHVVRKGDGPPVLMLHGFPEHWFAWRYQIDALAGAGFRAIAPDLRGYNLTERPPNKIDYSMDHLCADVDALIDAHGGGPVHLVAHDWGGGVAWIYAARKPERLRSLSIMNAPHPRVFLRHVLTNPRQMLRSWYMLFFQIPRVPEWFFLRDPGKETEKMFRGWARRKEMFPDEVIAKFRDAMTQPGALTAGINWYRAVLPDRKSFREVRGFPKIRVPTLVIWAGNDRALGPELVDDIDKQIDAPCRLHRIPGCSHWVQQEEPEEVNRVLIEFLREQEAARS